MAVSRHKYHLYRKENIGSERRTYEKKFFQYGNDAFVIIITTKRKNEFNFPLKFDRIPDLFNTYRLAVSYLAEDNYTNSVCVMAHTNATWLDCRQITNWDQRMSTIATWPTVLCLRMPRSLYDLLYGTEIINSVKLKMGNINLFDRKENYTMADWTEAALSKLHNLTIVQNNPSCPIRVARLEFDYELGSENYLAYANLVPVMPLITRSTGFQFFTCYREQFISFKIYVAPFQPNLWVALIISLVVVITSVSVYKFFGGYEKVSFSAWLFILATMFEEPGQMAKKIERATYFRLILGSWCLMSIFLTNCYNGLMISELNAPLPSFEPKTFHELICLKLSLESTERFFRSDLPAIVDSRIAKELRFVGNLTMWYFNAVITSFEFDPRSNPHKRDDCFNLLSIKSKDKGFSPTSCNPELLSYILSRFEDIMYAWRENSFLRNYYNLLLSLSLPIHSHHPKNMTYLKKNTNLTEMQEKIESEIIKCGKSVYIVKSDVIDAEYVFLSKSYPWRKFYKGKQILESSSYGVAFRMTGISKIPVYFKSFVESGVHGRIEQELIARINEGRDPVEDRDLGKPRKFEEVDSLGFEGTFATFFIIWGIAIGLALPVFVFEVRHAIRAEVTQDAQKAKDEATKPGLTHPRCGELLFKSAKNIPRTGVSPLNKDQYKANPDSWTLIAAQFVRILEEFLRKALLHVKQDVDRF
ncbi:hypothetical protein Fcan01_24504 [Folsomia candida]|uniref:Uncharacterized protein n=1 Tax=Folsomia candida TaxID=158441 RepID=A0A226D663_FOLCA|nr:hypothetical protein Fcan01_24504 [Folsomia candida]